MTLFLSLRSMAVLSGARLSGEAARKIIKVVPTLISSRFLCPRPPLSFSSPNQNRHATRATSFRENYLKSILVSVKSSWFCIILRVYFKGATLLID